MEQIIVKTYSIDQINREEWDAQIFQFSNIAQTYEWAQYRQSDRINPLFLIATRQNITIGSWLVFVRETLLGTIVEIDSEPLIVDLDRRDEIIQVLFSEIEQMKPLEIRWSNYTLSRYAKKEFFTSNNFDIVQKYNAFIVNLKQDTSLIWENMDKKVRNDIRFAAKNKVQILESDNIREYSLLDQQTYKRSNLPPTDFTSLKKLFYSLKPKNLVHLFFAVQYDAVISGAIILCCGKKALYFKGATSDNPVRGSSNLLHWEIMKKLKTEGFEIYDLGGISLDFLSRKALGIQRFKSGFGGREFIFYGGIKTSKTIKGKFFRVVKLLYIIFRKIWKK
jgi:lipid II:glycine glycyltransferase (peptidoglycan interpeptide bridge formation enzyme)